MPQEHSILWVDDEIEMLKPHLLFLREKGYAVTPVSNGDDAISMVRTHSFDLVLLDEMMPGKDGLQTLQEIRHIDPNIPIVMVTKNEEEQIMDQAIGRRADDYLLKPVQPNQILLAIRRILERHRITETQVARDYVSQFGVLDPASFGQLDHAGWIDSYLRMIAWDMQFDAYRHTGLTETHEDQKRAANYEFSRHVVHHYRDWVRGGGPEMSPDVFKNHVFPALQRGKQVAFVVIDCMRLDQWMAMELMLDPYFRIERQHYYSILPTATPYSRNALFAGLYPLEIRRRHPAYWDVRDEGDKSLNRFERELLELQLKRLGAAPDLKVRYAKVFAAADAQEVLRSLERQVDAGLYALVFNFIDQLAHGRSQSALLQEMAPDEAAFRTLARSWFGHSALFEILQKMAGQGFEVFVTTDHGSVLGKRPTVATGNRDTSTNVRYKYGDNLGYDEKGAFKMTEPEEYMLPKLRSTQNYIIAKENFYFVYPTKFRQYEKQFFGSFQHGGVSLEEMILPIAHLVPRR